MDEINELMGLSGGPISIDDLLNEYDVKNAISKPIWLSVRTEEKNKDVLVQAAALLKSNGIRCEVSYG